jgi:methyl-accepting chemotaxis protein
MSDGDFTVESTCPGNYVGDMRATLNSMNTIKSTLGRTLKDISISAGKVSDNSSQISDGSQALAQGATEQAGSVEELSSTISSVNDKVQTNAENAEKASKIALRTKDAITESNREMHKLTTSMDEIEEASNKIQDVISIIDNIAFQTNILSLNAAIEAARAGQAGKGFAVVATEVNSLSQEIKSLVNEIAGSMAELLENNNRLVASLEDTRVAIEQSHERISETEQVINTIRTVADSVREEGEQMGAVISTCDKEMDSVAGNIEESKDYFRDVAQNVKQLKNKITKKGYMFEDMHNVLAQISPMIDRIAKEE